MRCKEAGKNVQYLGETGRTGYDRGREHLLMMEKKNRESPMVEHGEDCHQGESLLFEMEVLEIHPTPLQRQTREQFLISTAKPGTTINRKGEWGQNLPPKLQVEGEEEDEGKRKRMQGDPPREYKSRKEDDDGGD